MTLKPIVPGPIKIKGKNPFRKVKIAGRGGKDAIEEQEIKVMASKLKGNYISSMRRATFATERLLNGWLDEAVDKALYQWPRVTIRQNGQSVSSPRNIVDTGRLKNSKNLSSRFGKTFAEVSIQYRAEYAAYVHWGAYIYPYGNTKRTRVYTPSRPWIIYAIAGKETQSLDETDKFVDAFMKALLDDLRKVYSQ